jgi:hypothetical protein
MTKTPMIKDQAWIDRQKKNLTVKEPEFAVALCFYPCGWDDHEAVQLYARLLGKVKILQNKWRYRASSWHKSKALDDVKRAWQKVQDHDESKGWPHHTWEEKFGNMTPVEIVEYLVDAMLATAYEIEGVSDE